MKKYIIALTVLFALTMSANAMSYEQARQQALFLTDKMAYELNLTEDQYEAAYEINLDYLMGVNSYDDVYGVYWTQRNLDLGYVLFDWQYSAFCAASYFYRPLYWDAGYWHFAIYARYPHRDYFYFGRPYFWTVYRGGHSWRRNGGRSWYSGRSFGTNNGSGRHFGMQDGYKRGDYRNGFDNRTGNNVGSSSGTVRSNNMGVGRRSNGTVGGSRTTTTARQSAQGTRSGTQSGVQRSTGTGTGAFGTRRSTSNSSNSRNISARESSTRTTVTKSASKGTSSNYSKSAGSSSSPSRSFSPSRSSGSSSGSSLSTRSAGGNHSSGGGRR